jgi:hypothetical protein
MSHTKRVYNFPDSHVRRYHPYLEVSQRCKCSCCNTIVLSKHRRIENKLIVEREVSALCDSESAPTCNCSMAWSLCEEACPHGISM